MYIFVVVGRPLGGQRDHYLNTQSGAIWGSTRRVRTPAQDQPPMHMYTYIDIKINKELYMYIYTNIYI